MLNKLHLWSFQRDGQHYHRSLKDWQISDGVILDVVLLKPGERILAICLRWSWSKCCTATIKSTGALSRKTRRTPKDVVRPAKATWSSNNSSNRSVSRQETGGDKILQKTRRRPQELCPRWQHWQPRYGTPGRNCAAQRCPCHLAYFAQTFP